MTQMAALMVAYAAVDADPLVVDCLIMASLSPYRSLPICQVTKEKLRNWRLYITSSQVRALSNFRNILSPWYHAGIVSGQRYNDKGEILYNPPGHNPPARHQGRRHDTLRPA